jgi:hypothetical protein
MRSTRLTLPLSVLVAGLTGLGTYWLASPKGNDEARAALVRVSTVPTAAVFGRDFVDTANAYAEAHGDPARLANPDCVQASRGHYMCSYGIVVPGRAVDCHLMQAEWTPGGLSSFRVTLAGRALRCESLRAALDSLP